MANEWIVKDYAGGVTATAITGGAISGSATSITVTDGSTFPDGSGGKFVISIDRGLPAEEKILITSRSGNTFTVSNRGYDGTPAVGHNDAAVVEHVLDSYSVEQANAHSAAAAAVGSMSYRSAAFGYSEIPIGASGLPLTSNGTAPGFAALGLAGISAALLEILCPAGTIRETINGSADTGWALFNQTLVGAQSAYPVLWGKAPAAWKSGANLVLPSMTDRMVQGFGAVAIGANGGTNTKTIASGNLPVHTHVIDHDHGTQSTTNESSHTHAVGSLATNTEVQSHTHTLNDGGSLISAVGSSATWNFGNEIVNGSSFVLFAEASSLSAQSSGHTHTISGSTGAPGNHAHSVDLPNFTGSSGNGGFANTALDVQQASLAVVYQIKVH